MRARLLRTVTGLLAAGAVVAAGVAAPDAAARAAQRPAASAPVATEHHAAARPKVDPRVLRRIDAGRRTDYWVELRQKADLSAAYGMSDWSARGQYVVDRLEATARWSQAPVLRELRALGARVTPFWIDNSVLVSGSTSAQLDAVLRHAEVRQVRLHEVHRLPDPLPAAAVPAVGGVEWGVADIRADQVWARFGDRGEGIVVGSIDTGVQFDHPALADRYRGAQPGGGFDHDYSWYDPSEDCGSPSTPCDDVGHGTHTMGTMVGAGGIGVAPQATWITAKGCAPGGCSEYALLSSAQWMLAPTRVDGTHPDADLRPMVVNNSWGGAGADPWYRDSVQAWLASGIFPAFANGNEGAGGCRTSGSPGAYPESYGVGAYDVDGDIAPFSSRGPSGFEDAIKPDVSGPGVAVRSSVPGDGYDVFSGTSMATPHVAGVVALMLSASPALRGDVAATEAILDQTARDAPDTAGCGGTLADNNTFGEGRVDALAAVDAAPRGDVVRLSGTVTDEASGDPVPGVDVAVTGGIAVRRLVTDDDGSYGVDLTAGEYDVTVSGYGWAPQTRHVTLGGDDRADFALVAEPRTVVSGTVRDGSGHGWPLYARIDVAGYPGGPVFTDPVTGRYRISLVDGVDYTLAVTSLVPGYTGGSRAVRLPDDAAHQDFGLAIDGFCAAPGYVPGGFTGLHESFDTTTTPPGWTVVDNAGTGEVWQFDDEFFRTNLTGGTGGFAVVDSDRLGTGTVQDTELVTPSVDFSGFDSPVLTFAEDAHRYQGEVFDVDLSIDGGTTWTTVDHNTTSTDRGPSMRTVPLPDAAGQADVRIRFHYDDATFAWWWEVDDVDLGQPACEVRDGGLVVGHTVDALSGDPVDGVHVTGPGTDTVSSATPGDRAVAGGFFAGFAPTPGPTTLTAAKKLYADTGTEVTASPDAVTEATLPLDVGKLSVAPVSGAADLGGSSTASLEITNHGTADARIGFAPRDSAFEVARTETSTGTSAAHSVKAPIITGRPTRQQVRELARSTRPADAAAPWEGLPDLPTARFDLGGVTLDGTTYAVGGFSYEKGPLHDLLALDGSRWVPLRPMHETREAPAVVAIRHQLYVFGGFDDAGVGRAAKPSLEVYDPRTDAWAYAPSAPIGMAGAGAAVVDDKAYFAGGCQDDFCLFNTDALSFDPTTRSWTRISPYPVPVIWLSCAGDQAQHRVLCAGGLSDPTHPGDGSLELTSAYSYDPSTDTWSPIGSLPVGLWASSSAVANGRFVLSGGVSGHAATDAGFAYDPFVDDWVPLPPSGRAAYRGAAGCGLNRFGGVVDGGPDASGERLRDYSYCDAAPVPWVSLDDSEVTVPAGETVTVDVTLDAGEVTQPGRYDAVLVVSDDTPYDVTPVPVTLDVRAPDDWARVGGRLEGLGRCDRGSAPLPPVTIRMAGAHTTTDTSGAEHYAVWVDPADGPWSLDVRARGFARSTVSLSSLPAGGRVTRDLTLRSAVPCARARPRAIVADVRHGQSRTLRIRLADGGARGYRFAADEVPFAFSPLPRPPRASRTGTGWFGAALLPDGGVRYGHAQCSGDLRHLYVIDGSNVNHVPLARMQQYDAGNDSWTELADPPVAVEAPTAVCDAGRIHLLGGSGTDGHYVYDIATGQWTTAAPLPRKVRGAAGAVWDGRIYLVGGDADDQPGGTSRRVDVYDPATDTWTEGPSMPEAAVAAGSVQGGRYLYVVGGWGDAAPARNVRTTQRLDLATGTWSVGPTFAPAVADFALAATDQAIYAVGGDLPGGTLRDATRNTWRLPVADWPDGDWTAADELPLAMSGNSGGFCTVGFLGGEYWSVAGLDAFRFSDGETYLHGLGKERCADVRADVRWLRLSARSGHVGADETRVLKVTVDASRLRRGRHTASIVVTTDDGRRPEFRIPVRVRVRPPTPRIRRPYVETLGPL